HDGISPAGHDGSRLVLELAFAETPPRRMDFAQPPFVGIGDKSQQLIGMSRPELERSHFRLAGPQVDNALDNAGEVVAFDAVAGAFVGVEKEVEDGPVEETPRGVQCLGDENWFGAAFREWVV